MEYGNFIVSIIIPVFNLYPYVEKCIESIQKQTYKDLEIIIIDDGSTDGTSALCDKFAANDSRIKVIHQENTGVVIARRRGIELAKGKYISFVDGDDWIEPETIKYLVGQIGNAELITSGVYEEISIGNIVERYDEFPEGKYFEKTHITEILKNMIYDFSQGRLQRLTPWGCNKLFLRAPVKKIYQKLDPEITFAEDTVFIYQYLLQCESIVITHQCFYHYRYREGSALHTVNTHRLIDINKVYLALECDFRQHELSESLLIQLQKWVMIMSYWAINIYMGFDKRIYIPEFVADLSGLENKRLILYGAGKLGNSTYEQLKKFGYHIVLWVDKNYEYYQAINREVTAPDEIFNEEYDLIFIAVSKRDFAEKIKEELLEEGIPENKLIWKEPMNIFKM